jgi:hypothetical protein
LNSLIKKITRIGIKRFLWTVLDGTRTAFPMVLVQIATMGVLSPEGITEDEV